MKKTNLKGTNILVTGARGFVGQNLVKRLEELGAHVFGISHTSGSKNIIKASVLEYDKIHRLIKNKKISLCFHLAGEALVEAGQQHPYDTFKTNIEGTLNILEIARVEKMDRVIVASSSHVYGKNKVPYFEGYTPRPSRPYETSKACTDLIAKSYADTFNLPVLIPRFVNIYGPGDRNFNRLIPRTIQTILTNVSPTMWGGDAMRDYLYIDDAINAYIALATVDIIKVVIIAFLILEVVILFL
jgi:CDP-glucose 4,6-dehydratase